MSRSKDTKPGPPGQFPKKDAHSVDDAFDIWLQRGLHQLYDDVASEPVPDELLRLIEEDRVKRDR